jgi:hypothetical protein
MRTKLMNVRTYQKLGAFTLPRRAARPGPISAQLQSRQVQSTTPSPEPKRCIVYFSTSIKKPIEPAFGSGAAQSSQVISSIV